MPIWRWPCWSPSSTPPRWSLLEGVQPGWFTGISALNSSRGAGSTWIPLGRSASLWWGLLHWCSASLTSGEAEIGQIRREDEEAGAFLARSDLCRLVTEPINHSQDRTCGGFFMGLLS